MSYSNSNIPSKAFYLPLSTAILRTTATTGDKNNFLDSSRKLASRFQKEGDSADVFSKTLYQT